MNSSAPTFLWHDYETFGLDMRIDRPAQFAAVRTDLALQPVAEPVVLHCRLSDDCLPQPRSCLITGITPQRCDELGVDEARFARALQSELASANSCIVGYNNLRFDDGFTRHLFYRNFLDPYAHEWQQGNSRWDLIDLVRMTALIDAVKRGELDQLRIPQAPLDVLAQQIVAEVAAEPWSERALYALLTRAQPYRALPYDTFAELVRMLGEGYSSRRGRRGAYLYRDLLQGMLRPRPGARLTALTCGGTIPDTADYDVILEPAGTLIGSVNEDFAVESMAGDIFQLGNSSWRIVKVESGRLRVEVAARVVEGIVEGCARAVVVWLLVSSGRPSTVCRILR